MIKKIRGNRCMSNAEFLAKAAAKHGETYDYSQTFYVAAIEKITVICRTHGPFTQRAYSHLLYGCKKCGNNVSSKLRKMSVAKFCEIASERHDFRYNYEMVEFECQHDLIKIICETHGVFEQAANDHLKGHGCRKCGTLAGAEKRSIPIHTNATYIMRAADRHRGAGYSYEKTEFIDKHNDVTVNCSAHGYFTINSYHHLAGGGCEDCKTDRKKHKAQNYLTFAEFYTEALIVHEGQYEYASYNGIWNKAEVLCSKHGVFLQRAYNHLKGHGCPKCGRRKAVMQNAWLDSLNIQQREEVIEIEGKRYIVDGYDSASRTVYEFNGDFWHGNPAVYPTDAVNSVCKCTFGALFIKTQERAKAIIAAGYSIVEIWEHDWKNMNDKLSSG